MRRGTARCVRIAVVRCRMSLEVLPALRLRGLDKEESADVLGEVLLLSLCGDLDDRSFRHDVAWKKSASCFVGLPVGRAIL